MMPWLFRQLAERFGVGASFASLGRILVWSAVGLFAIARVAPVPAHDQRSTPFNQQMDSAEVIEIGADVNDLRGFHPRPQDDSVFKIGWVGGSSLQERTESGDRFIPQIFQEHVPVIDGRPVEIDMYFLTALRLWDEYLATLAAISDDVDLLVITLNPTWLFNDDAIASWPNLGPTAVESLLTRPEAWPLAAAMVTPSDLAIGLVGNEFAAIDGQWSYAESLRRRLADWTPLDRSQPPEPPAEVSELGAVAAMQRPIEFWWKYNNPRPEGLDDLENDAYQLNNANPDDQTWNQLIVGWMAESIVESGIPALVYLAPIRSSSLESPAVDEALTSIETRLGTYADDFASPLVSFGPESLSRELPPLPFRDLIHLSEIDPVADVLQQRLCELVNSVDLICDPLEQIGAES